MAQNVFITGTSTGFGNLTALALASRGHRVFATMRDPDGKNREHAARLRAVKGIEVLALDVTSESSVDAAVASAQRSAGHLDAVVNNAGLAIIGLAETITPDQLLRLFDTNVVGVQRVDRAVLPAMRARKSGLLVHVSSGLGRIVIPIVALYGSTKFALEAISDAYRYELKARGVEVTVVQPGAYPTELGSVDPDGADQARAKGYGALEGALESFHKRMGAMKSRPDAPNPQEVADAIVKLIETPAGQRPARVAVDALKSPLVPRLNDAHAQAQRELLLGMGMGSLAD